MREDWHNAYTAYTTHRTARLPDLASEKTQRPNDAYDSSLSRDGRAGRLLARLARTRRCYDLSGCGQEASFTTRKTRSVVALWAGDPDRSGSNKYKSVTPMRTKLASAQFQ